MCDRCDNFLSNRNFGSSVLPTKLVLLARNQNCLLETLELLHLKAVELSTHCRDGISLEHLEMTLQQRAIAACVIVSNFSNPLGSCMSDRKKQQLVELLDRYDLPLIEDDIYSYHNCLRLNCGLPWSEEIELALQTLGILSQKQLLQFG